MTLAPPTVPATLTKFLDPLRIPPVIRPRTHAGVAQVDIEMHTADIRLHSSLPKTRMWTYDKSVPGPTIVVRRGQRLHVRWHNRLTGPFPVDAVELPADPNSPQTAPPPGRAGTTPIPFVDELIPWTTVHLHGAVTGGDNDGWSENGIRPGDSQLSEYPNDQQATTLWYHDHGMHVTSLNVMTGLAGMYLIRDDEEDALDLPKGDREIPLVLCDRNLDLDSGGALTGQLLYKVRVKQTTPSRLAVPFLGPFNVVNGVIWPHLEVQPRWYRFRVLNASTNRPYFLQLVDQAGDTVQDAVFQIGSDGGLLPEPVSIDPKTPKPAGRRVTSMSGPLILAPAERADLLIDFREHAGTSLRLVNRVPLGGEPDVMEFRVKSEAPNNSFSLPPATDFPKITPYTESMDHEHTHVAIVEPKDRHPELWELEKLHHAPPALGEGHIQVKEKDPTTGLVVTNTYQEQAKYWDDRTTIHIEEGALHQWRFINLTNLTHPIHIHLTEFQIVRRETISGTFNAEEGHTDAPLTLKTRERPVNERGWKDVFQVNAGEAVTVMGRFSGASGRYVYHCHLLDHEDGGMMRPFVVVPAEINKFMPDHGGHGGGHGGGHHHDHDHDHGTSG